VAGAIAGNISREATQPSGNILVEGATRVAKTQRRSPKRRKATTMTVSPPTRKRDGADLMFSHQRAHGLWRTP
jgi:hypothetical protein